MREFMSSKFKSVSRSRMPRRGGFTLIELLAATAILLIMLAILGRMFASTSIAFRSGIRSAQQGQEVRAVLEFVARDLSQALFDYYDGTAATTSNRMDVVVTAGTAGYGGSCQEIRFFRPHYTTNTAERGISLVRYRVQQKAMGRWSLYRTELVSATDIANVLLSGSAPPWPDEENEIMENVRSFAVDYATQSTLNGTPTTAAATLTQGTAEGGRLGFVDLYVEVIDEDSRQKYGLGITDWVEKRAKRYVQRIFFLNYGGYYMPDR